MNTAKPTSHEASLRDLSCADDYDPNSMPVPKAREVIAQFLAPITTVERVAVRAALGRVLAADVIEQPHDVGLIAALQADPQFGHVEHAIVGLEFRRQWSKLRDDPKLLVAERRPLLEKPIRLPFVDGRGIAS